VRFAAVYYQVGNLPTVDRGPQAVCTGGRHEHKNEIRKKNIVLKFVLKFLDTCVPHLIDTAVA